MPLKRGRGDTVAGRGRLFKKQRGAPNLIPEKYWRMLKRYTTTEDVTADYTFPAALTGDQAYIELAQKTITEARLLILEEILTVGPPLVGEKTDDKGDFTITETLVNEGDPLDSDSEVWDSRVAPLGNGKAIKITVRFEHLPGVLLTTKKVEEDGIILTTTRQRKHVSDISPTESLIGGLWKKVSREDETDTVSIEVIESRTVPGNSVPSSRVDEDGVLVSISTILKDQTAIADGETLVGGSWKRTFKKPRADLIAYEVIEVRTVPGNPIASTKLDEDGKTIDTARTLKATSSITTSELISAGVWTKTTKREISNLVSWEIVEARPVPGNIIPSAKVDQDHVLGTVTKTLKDSTLITPGATNVGDVITVIDKEAVTDKVSWEIKRVSNKFDPALYSIRIPETVVPIEFRATLPTRIESHVVVGTAAAPSLGVGEFFRQERQLTLLLKEVRVETLDLLTLPVSQVGLRNTEEYGGGTLLVLRELNSYANVPSPTTFTGLLITASEVSPLGNGLWFRETLSLYAAVAWPTNTGQHWDEEMQLFVADEVQVVDAGTSPSIGANFVETIKPIDQWRSQRIRQTKAYPGAGSPIITDHYAPFSYPGLMPPQPATILQMRKATAMLTRHKVRTWWVFSVPKPEIPVTEIITDSIIVPDAAGTGYARADNVLHDGGFASLGFFYAETSPSYSQYALGTLSGGSSTHNYASLYAPGTGGCFVGQVIPISGGGFGMTITVTSIYDVPGGASGLINGWTNGGGTYPASPTLYGPFSAANGTQWYVWAVAQPDYVAGSAWIGTERIVAAKVLPTDIPHVWKIQTESVVMR